MSEQENDIAAFEAAYDALNVFLTALQDTQDSLTTIYKLEPLEYLQTAIREALTDAGWPRADNIVNFVDDAFSDAAAYLRDCAADARREAEAYS